MNTPKSLRLHIGIFGRRNVGKSSLLNAITRQHVSIVSNQAGTATDPVEKPMELLPIGPVLFIDTAGIDDVGALGTQRVEKTREIFERTEIAVLVTEADTWGKFEEDLLREFRERKIPTLVVLNKIDIAPAPADFAKRLCVSPENLLTVVEMSAVRGDGVFAFRDALIQLLPAEFLHPPALVSDLVNPGESAVLVVPIDKEAPRGRLLLPQVQVIRDLLDNDAYAIVSKEREFSHVLGQLRTPPKIVITDSSCFLKAGGDTPDNVWLTSFSILFSRFKGDLVSDVQDVCTIDRLRPGDRILISEACSHHPITEDIGRVKIPRWLTQYVGGKLDITVTQGHDFPADLSSFRLVIACGSCMLNRKEVLSRGFRCRAQGVPFTNYGLTIGHSLGILERALRPFPAAHEKYCSLRGNEGN